MKTTAIDCNAPFPPSNINKTEPDLLSTTEPPAIWKDLAFGQSGYERRQHLGQLGEKRVRLAKEGHVLWQQIVSAPAICGMGIEEHTAVERGAEMG